MAHTLVPKRTGKLDSTIKVESGEDGSATVSCGGEEAPYAEDVNSGYTNVGGHRIPGTFFWTQAEEYAKAESQKRAATTKAYE